MRRPKLSASPGARIEASVAKLEPYAEGRVALAATAGEMLAIR